MDTLNRRGMLRIHVDRPIKTVDRYEFHYDVSGHPFTRATAVYRLKSVIDGFGSLFRTRRRFGFRALNFGIAHNEVWDSVFPLMFLTRYDGPLFNTGYDTAVIRFRYPVLESVRQFFVERAANCGIFIKVEADTVDRTYDIRGDGNILAFGGGKESRLLFGLLRELGETPKLARGVAANADIGEIGRKFKRAADLSSLEISKPFWGSLAERVMPGLMAGAAHFYFGATLLDVHLTHPWHQHYDLASWQGQRELTELFRSLGVDMRMHAPVNVPPSNLVQKMLSVRYPELHAQQRSVPPQATNVKNLHVSLLKLYHDIPIDVHCSEELFCRLVRDFVAYKLSSPLDFGFHDVKELVHREMTAIIWRLRDHHLLEEVRAQIPSEWDASWIDFLHTYVNPDVDLPMLEIFREYATDYAPAPGEYRIPTSGSLLQDADATTSGPGTA